MRIAVISESYPPCETGWGYMQLCEEVTDGLAARGHEIEVLTGRRADGPEPDRPYPVCRELPLDPDWSSPRPAWRQFVLDRPRRVRAAIAAVEDLIARCRPDAVMIWNFACVPRAALARLENAGPPVVYYLASYLPEEDDEWRTYWRAAAPGLRGAGKRLAAPLARRALGPPARLGYRHPLCVSEFLRARLIASGRLPAGAVVVRNGLDLDRFAPAARPPLADGRLRGLIAGRVVPEKGIETVLEAVALAPSRGLERERIGVTVLGSGPAPYERYLRQRIAELGVGAWIDLRPPVDRRAVPDLLAAHDALLLPSTWDEPLARAMLEAMAMGRLVIGTVTGGSGEVLRHGETGLVFDPGDARGLADRLAEALDRPAGARAIAARAAGEVRRRFDLQRTIERVEAELVRARRHEAVAVAGKAAPAQ